MLSLCLRVVVLTLWDIKNHDEHLGGVWFACLRLMFVFRQQCDTCFDSIASLLLEARNLPLKQHWFLSVKPLFFVHMSCAALRHTLNTVMKHNADNEMVVCVVFQGNILGVCAQMCHVQVR